MRTIHKRRSALTAGIKKRAKWPKKEEGSDGEREGERDRPLKGGRNIKSQTRGKANIR